MAARVTKGLLAAAALLGLAIVAFVLAADVRAWRTAISSGDVVYASSPADATWTPRTRLGSLAGSLLGTDDDVTSRRALKLYAVAAATHLRLDNATQVQTTRAAAQDALTAAAASGDSQRSSQARTLLGLLTYRASASGGEQDQLESAIADFTDAIRADPSNAAAKFDLELLLRLSAAQGTRPGQGLGSGSGRGGRRGAGGGSAGRGY
jgi:hypothetical protein